MAITIILLVNYFFFLDARPSLSLSVHHRRHTTFSPIAHCDSEVSETDWLAPRPHARIGRRCGQRTTSTAAIPGFNGVVVHSFNWWLDENERSFILSICLVCGMAGYASCCRARLNRTKMVNKMRSDLFFLGRATRREKNFVFLCSVGLLLMVLSYYDDCFVCVFGLIGTFDAILMGIVYYWCGDDGDCSGWCQLTSLSIIVYHRRKVGIDWCRCGWFRMAKRHKRNGHKSIQD